jgi:hypothetical protein
MNASTVRDVLGREREIAKRYDDGSFNCPFCTYAVWTPAERCENPGCPASVDAIANPVCAGLFREQLAAEQRMANERREREANHAAAMAHIKAARAAREEAVLHVATVAANAGACVDCAVALVQQYRPAKYIRHRGPCPRSRSRRGVAS